MSNRRREIGPGSICHVNTHSLHDMRILGTDVLREAFLCELASCVEKFEWICDAYVLMRNHYHLLLRTPKGRLSDGMKQLNGNFARIYNRYAGRSGPVWQTRFHHDLIETDAHLLQAARYIVLNPVRARACSDPREYRWSSYGPTAGLAHRPEFLTTDWLLAQLGGSAAYRRFVAEGSPAATLRGLLLLEAA